MGCNQGPNPSPMNIENLRIALDEYVILAVISPKGKITYINEKFCAISKFSREELLAQDYHFIDSGHQPKEFIENLWATIAAGQVWTGEIKNRTKDGSFYWVAATIIPILDEDRQPVQYVAILADITQRKNKETTSSRLAAIVESSDDAIVAKDLNGVILSWNSGAERIFGYTGEEIIGASVMRLIPPDKEEEESQILGKIQCGEGVEQIETVRRSKAGRLIAVSVTAFPIKNADGKVVGVSSLVRDITDRQRGEFDLRRERERAKQYLDIAEVILLQLHLDGKIALVNRYACSVLGWEAGELIGRDWIETCLPTRIRGTLREKFEELIGGDLSVVENPILTKSGEERLIEWRNRMVHDDEGRILGTLSSGTDITERYRAIEALRTAEERMRFALDAAEVGIWDMDYTTGVLHWSEILKSQLGLPPSNFDGTFEAFVERIHPDDRELTLATINDAMKSGSDFSIVHRVIWPDGTVRWVSSAGRILQGEDGQPIRGVGISQDVTERKHAEAEFKRLNNEIQLQRLWVFKATMRTVQDIVNNFLNALQVVRIDAEELLSPEMHATFDHLIQETATRLNMLAALDTIAERKMAVGPGIDFPGSSVEPRPPESVDQGSS